MGAKKIRIVTSTGQTITGREETIVFNSAGAITFLLGPSYGDGRCFDMKNIGAGAVTLTPDGTDVVWEETSVLTKALAQGESINITDATEGTWICSYVDFETTPITEGGTGISGTGVTKIFYVDGGRTDTYTQDGSILRPYKTILAAQNVVNAASALLLGSAANFELCKFVINIAPGKYTDNVAITTARYLRWNMEGVEVSGNVTVTQNQLGLSDYYGKVEFVGGLGNRAYRGNCGMFSGTITFLKDAYDSLAYDAFIGCSIKGNLQYGTSSASTHGTWVLCLINSYFPTSTAFISEYLTAASENVLIESYGYNKIVAHIAKQDGSATKIGLYDCNETYFDLVNITPVENCRVKNCTFNSTTSIVAAKTLSIDHNSYKSLRSVTPTLTGMTVTLLDEWQPDPNCVYYVDGNRTDVYTANGSMDRPYLTIDAALTVINADSLAHQTASTYDQANYVIDVAQGTYDEALAIGNVKNLRFNLHGATISGAITYTSTMVGGSADYYYSRLEFVGCEGNRAEKGTAARLTGLFTATRNNDSLCYVSLKGVHHAGNMYFNTNGTWVVSMKDVFFSGYLYTGGSAIALLETTGHTEFGAYSGTGTGHIAVPTTNAVVAVSLYNVDNTEFDLINISNAAGSRITNCRFKSDVTITAGSLAMDGISYRQMIAQTETITGTTLSFLDGFVPAPTQTFFVDGSRTDSYTADGSMARPYKTITAAVTAIDALAAVQIAIGPAEYAANAKYILNVNPGTYSGDIAITNVKYLRFNIEGVLITGNITYDTTMVGGTADQYYSKVEFVGGSGVRAEKGNTGRITGTFTATRNNDSLCYVSFTGIDLQGNVKFTTQGTWVVHFHNVRCNAFFEGSTLNGGQVLLETTGWVEFGSSGHIANSADGSATTVAIYNAQNTEFDLINITPLVESRFYDCRFKSNVTITAQNIYIDANSYKSLVAQTETLTGATVIPLDGALPNAAGVYTCKTVKKTVSWHGGSGDFKLPDAANMTESQLDLGALVPALARIVDVFAVTTEAAVFSGGATTLVADVGTSAGDGSLVTSATIYAINAIIASPNAGAFIATPGIAATNIFINSTPGANWDTQTAGQVSVYVTYIDVAGL